MNGKRLIRPAAGVLVLAALAVLGVWAYPQLSPPPAPPVAAPVSPVPPRASAPTPVPRPVLPPPPAPSPAVTSTAVTPPRPTPSTVAAPPARSGITLFVPVTFYGAADNDPPGSAAIEYPQLHRTAGGTGTYADPITFATAYDDTYPPGTRIYLPRLKKYFVMEDSCACDQPDDHVDLWAGGIGADPGVLECEDQLTIDENEQVVKNPDSRRPVDSRPLYSKSLGCNGLGR